MKIVHILTIVAAYTMSWNFSVAQSCVGTGGINQHRWNNISGTSITNLTSNSNYPNNPSVTSTITSFEISSNSGSNYGVRVFGYLCPPTSGNYVFWIASDDQGELWLSTDASSSNKVRIAYHKGYTNSRQWSKYSTQKSALKALVAGQVYYIEALMKEGTGSDNLAVGWAKPGQSTTAPSQVIPGSNLMTQSNPDNTAPTAPMNLVSTNVTENSMILNWAASTDNIGVAGYDIYLNGNKLNSSLVTATSYTVSGLSPGTAYSFYVVAKDAAGNTSLPSNTLEVTTQVIAQCPESGTINFQIWNGISGTTISSLTANANYPNSPTTAGTLTTFETSTNSADNYGIKVYGYLCPPTSGVYYFWIASDDNGELWLSTTDSPANKVRIAYHNNWTNARQWTKYSSQKSGAISLVAGELYYIEALMKEGTGGDNLAVGWAKPGQSNASPSEVIPGNRLLPELPEGPDTLPPTPPSNLAALTLTQTSVNLTWMASSDNVGVTGYDIYQDGVKINGGTISATSFSVTGLTASTNYSYFIKAKDAAGNESAPSNTLNITTPASPDTEPPTAPSSLFASDLTQSTLNLFWTASTDNVGVIGYDVYQNGVKINSTNVAGTTYSVSGLSASVSYAFYIVAKDAAGNSSSSSILNITTPDTQAPTTPANLSSSSITQVSFILSWAASSDNVGVSGYDVYQNGNRINSSNITATSYAVNGLLAATTYSYYVIAKDAAGNSSPGSAAIDITTLSPNPGIETFTQRTVIASQSFPYDLVYGPDGNLWYIERTGGRVNFVNISSGIKTTLLTLGSNMVQSAGQDGLLGLALHPQLLTGKPYVYIVYTYQTVSTTVRRTRIARYEYNSGNNSLINPVTILENIPGSNDHNGGRLAIGPDLKLYYSVGDMGSGQFDNASRTQNAQNTNVYEGKILRLNTEQVSGSWIPTDNPFGNAVYTFGHRNPQGLVWANVNGVDILYSDEHGPYSDDEVNVIQSGRNYGWPQVSGFCDGNYNGRTIGNFAVVSEQNNCVTLNAKEPLKSLFPAANPPSGGDNMTWPSTAPSGADFYGSDAIPGWQNSLLLAQLKRGALLRLKLSNDGQSIISDTIHYFQGKGRFRDVVVSPDGTKIYLACDLTGSTSGPTGGVLTTPPNAGHILEFTYVPPAGIASNNGRLEFINSRLIKDNTTDIFPNPASQYLVVYNYVDATERTIEIYNLYGQIMKREKSTSLATRLDISQIKNGFYVLKIADRNGMVIRSEKILIQR